MLCSSWNDSGAKILRFEKRSMECRRCTLRDALRVSALRRPKNIKPLQKNHECRIHHAKVPFCWGLIYDRQFVSNRPSKKNRCGTDTRAPVLPAALTWDCFFRAHSQPWRPQTSKSTCPSQPRRQAWLFLAIRFESHCHQQTQPHDSHLLPSIEEAIHGWKEALRWLVQRNQLKVQRGSPQASPQRHKRLLRKDCWVCGS